MYNQLRNLQKKAKELKSDMRILRRNVQAQAHAVRETLRDTFLRFKVVALAGNDHWMSDSGDPERTRLKKDEELYKQEVLKLEKDLCELETTVEELRSHVINKRTRVNMSDVENMALILSKSSKSVADLKARFPVLQENIKSQLSSEMDRMVTEERFMKEEPDRLETALKRCKKTYRNACHTQKTGFSSRAETSIDRINSFTSTLSSSFHSNGQIHEPERHLRCSILFSAVFRGPHHQQRQHIPHRSRKSARCIAR
jgi:predicted nuclease with TOPRIM domain